QMNPHFFFNALNTIGGFISKSDSKKAKFYISKFAKLMSVTLENSLDDLVTIEDEMKLVENYLHLEQMRENFEFEISIKEDLKDRLIPSLILQPIVENSIKHGFIDLDFKGRIEVYADKDALGNMIVKILDNGHGNDKSTNSQHTSVSSSLTQERLRLLCNDRAEYRMSFPKEGGTIVELKIPNLN
ncbi:MAG: histidine kinase, partial [Flavobacteriales bacterium]|nr:histidine kinase [Flavobacteriales bacterium]